MKTRTLFIFLVILGILAALFLFAFGEKDSMSAQKELKKEISLLKAQRDSLQRELDSRQEKIRLLQEDSFYIEAVARTKFGMTKKGEKAIQFIEE